MHRPSPRFHAMDSYSSYIPELKSNGSVLLPPNLIFSAEEVERLDAIQSSIPEEKVSNGDADDNHDIYIRRIVTDNAGEFPKRVNQPFSDQILEILSDEKRRTLFAKIFDSTSEYFIRRCQMNRLIEGSYVGLHLDAESNPDNEFSVIVQLGRYFQGGEFVIYPDDRDKQVFSPKHGTVLITTCRFRHEVTKVLANERKSLVYFYSKHGGTNRRDPSARCSRPGCRWCGEHLRSLVDGG